MRPTVHPAAFLATALLLCGVLLWLRPALPPAETLVAPRSGSRPPQTQRESIALDATILERYVGKYEGRADFTIELSMQKGSLFAQSPGSVPFELLATSETEFYLKGADVDVEFRIDDNGAVDGFIANTPYGVMSVDRVR
jgi:hypothetical protein